MQATTSSGPSFIAITGVLLILACVGALVRFGVYKKFMVIVPQPCSFTGPCEVMDCDDMHAQLTGCIEGEKSLIHNVSISGAHFVACVEHGACSTLLDK